MGYHTLRECIDDLAASGQLVRIDEPVDPHLEAAEIHRRVYEAGGPAVFYSSIKGCRFPMVSNLLGTMDRARYIFRDSLAAVRRLVELKAEPGEWLRQPLQLGGVARAALRTRPKRVRSGPVLAHTTTIRQLPQLVCWPDDGGAFITLGQVYSENADHPGLTRSNLGMYRIQLSGGRYQPDREIGLHYQIHRTIGIHHAAALRRGVPFPVNVFVGGPPAMNLAAVMPLPENLSELAFAGALGGRRVRMIHAADRLPIHADADFCISGTVIPGKLLPEGPFGDHLGYYSLAHDFPVLRVEQVFHRDDPIWPFTVVGRPPQEDTTFGALIHELTGPAIPAVLPGVYAVHAVDAAGVHPLLLAIGSERYVPYAERQPPQELLTQSNAILGQGQLSLAKYLMIVARGDNPALSVNDIPAFFRHLLERVDWRRDLHFQTSTTIDTLDYSSGQLNQGSKLVIAAAGPPQRELPTELPGDLQLPDGFLDARLVLPGILAVQGPRYEADADGVDTAVVRLGQQFDPSAPINRFPLVVVVDDSPFAAESLRNFLWVTFTRSNPASDVHGIGASYENKHWGCRGSLVIDARIKPHHAPPLVADPEVTRRVEALAAPGKPLHGVL